MYELGSAVIDRGLFQETATEFSARTEENSRLTFWDK
jgi:hypothetical protein